MLISQYFSDLKGALIDTAVFAFVSNAATLLLALFCDSFYGIGFVIGGMLFCVVSCINLFGYLKKLKYNVLSRQLMFLSVRGDFLRLWRTDSIRGLCACRRGVGRPTKNPK